jgi:hypothetical protein
VERQCAILFGDDDSAATQEVKNIQQAIVTSSKQGFQNLREEEERQYGEVSFFRWWHTGGKEGTKQRPKADGEM